MDQIDRLEQFVFVAGHHLDGDGGGLVCVHADVPAYNLELNLVFLADVDALVEALGVEEVAGEAEVHQREVSLQSTLLYFFALRVLGFGVRSLSLTFVNDLHVAVLRLLVHLPQSGDVEIVWSQFAVAADDGVEDLRRQFGFLLVQTATEI